MLRGPEVCQPLQVFTELVVQTVGQDLTVFSIPHGLLCVQGPVWDLVLARRPPRPQRAHLPSLAPPLTASPTPVTAAMAKALFQGPSILVTSTSKMCHNFPGVARDTEAAQQRRELFFLRNMKNSQV